MVRDLFVGVYAADKLPAKEYPGAYIANTDEYGKPGAHWVAFFTKKPGEVEAFDSFGQNLGLYSDLLSDWVGSDYLVMSGIQRQSFEATTCGQYCMFFTLLRCHGFSYQDVQSALVKHKLINDKFVCKCINKYFGLSTNTHDKQFLLEFLRR